MVHRARTTSEAIGGRLSLVAGFYLCFIYLSIYFPLKIASVGACDRITNLLVADVSHAWKEGGEKQGSTSYRSGACRSDEWKGGVEDFEQAGGYERRVEKRRRRQGAGFRVLFKEEGRRSLEERDEERDREWEGGRRENSYVHACRYSTAVSYRYLSHGLYSMSNSMSSMSGLAASGPP